MGWTLLNCRPFGLKSEWPFEFPVRYKFKKPNFEGENLIKKKKKKKGEDEEEKSLTFTNPVFYQLCHFLKIIVW